MPERRWWEVAVRLVPARHRDFGEAWLAEVPQTRGVRRAAWIAGGIWFMAREAAMRAFGYVGGLSAAVAVVVAVDRLGDSDDSGQVALLALLLASVVAGFAAPRLAWLSGLVIGAAISVANMVYVTWGPARAHPIEPAGLGGAATLLVLMVPAVAAAYAGAGLARLRTRRTRGVSENQP